MIIWRSNVLSQYTIDIYLSMYIYIVLCCCVVNNIWGRVFDDDWLTDWWTVWMYSNWLRFVVVVACLPYLGNYGKVGRWLLLLLLLLDIIIWNNFALISQNHWWQWWRWWHIFIRKNYNDGVVWNIFFVFIDTLSCI